MRDDGPTLINQKGRRVRSTCRRQSNDISNICPTDVDSPHGKITRGDGGVGHRQDKKGGYFCAKGPESAFQFMWCKKESASI